jgi:hypothetical protein
MSAARLHEAIRLFLADRFFWAIRKNLLAIGIARSLALNRRGLVDNPQMEPDERRLKTTSNRVAAVPMSSRFMPPAWLARALEEGHQQLSNASPDIARCASACPFLHLREPDSFPD